MSLFPGREVSVVPAEQPRHLRAVTFVDLWNLLRGAKGALGPLAQTFSWPSFAHELKEAAARSLGSSGIRFTAKTDQVHLLQEGVHIYGAASKYGLGPGSRQWLHETGGLSGFDVSIDRVKVEKYDCPHCGQKMRIRRESGTDAHLISDLMWLAWQDRYDVAIVVSGDADLLPSVERVQLSGRKVVVALFDGTSKASRRVAHGNISLNSVLLDGSIYPDGSRVSNLRRAFSRPHVSQATLQLVLEHGHDLEKVKDQVKNNVEAYLVDGWFTPNPKSTQPEEDQRSELLARIREETLDGLDNAK